MNADAMNLENFAQHDVIDQQHQGVAYSFQHPAGWQAESRLFWNFQHLHFPLVTFARAVSPNPPEMFEFLPSEQFTWTEPNQGFQQPGQNQSGIITMPPMSGIDALARLIIPKYRGDRQGIRVVGVNPVPNLVQTINATEITRPDLYDGATAKVEYVEQGREIEEEFYCCHYQVPPIFGTGVAIYSWGLARLFCFRAERGQLEAARPAFWKIASSIRLNPQWQQLRDRVLQQLTGVARQNTQAGWDAINAGWDRLDAAAQQSRQFMANNQAYVDGQQRRLETDWHLQPLNTQSQRPENTSHSQTDEYTSHEAFVDSVREEESIYNPNAPHNEKVSGYHDHIWTDQQGNVRATNDPNYDPNAGSDQNWTQARKKRIGD